MLNRLFVLLARFIGLLRAKGPRTGDYHVRDVRASPLRYHFSLRLKWWARRRLKSMSRDEREQFVARMKERGMDTTALDAGPREILVQFLKQFAARTHGALESLTLLEDTTDSKQQGGRFLAAFASGARMIWTVVQTPDGTVSIDGTSAT